MKYIGFYLPNQPAIMSELSQRYRPSWDDYFMSIARIVATRSTCDRLEAGAVLVKNNRIISTGYNGSPPGLPHCDEAGHLMEEGHCVRTIHGEHNAILQAATIPGASTEGSTMYTKYTFCIHCAKYIIAAGVKKVIYGAVYRNAYCIDYLREAGVDIEMYTPNPEWNARMMELFSHDIEVRVAKEGEVKLEEKK
jgi:dCMP deaminase